MAEVHHNRTVRPGKLPAVLARESARPRWAGLDWPTVEWRRSRGGLRPLEARRTSSRCIYSGGPSLWEKESERGEPLSALWRRSAPGRSPGQLQVFRRHPGALRGLRGDVRTQGERAPAQRGRTLTGRTMALRQVKAPSNRDRAGPPRAKGARRSPGGTCRAHLIPNPCLAREEPTRQARRAKLATRLERPFNVRVTRRTDRSGHARGER